MSDGFPDQAAVKRRAMSLLAEEIEFMTNPICRDICLARDDRELIVEALRFASQEQQHERQST